MNLSFVTFSLATHFVSILLCINVFRSFSNKGKHYLVSVIFFQLLTPSMFGTKRLKVIVQAVFNISSKNFKKFDDAGFTSALKTLVVRTDRYLISIRNICLIFGYHKMIF